MQEGDEHGNHIGILGEHQAGVSARAVPHLEQFEALKTYMPHTFSRNQLHELVWSEPMKTLARKYGISDVGLSKACRRYNIPVPERGYWAKLRAGKHVKQRPLPRRGPGMSDEVTIGAGNRWHYRSISNEEILQSTPSAPVFEREIEDVIAEVQASVRRVTVPKTMHRHIA